MPHDPSYAAYLLRLRKLQDENRSTWVASIQSVATGENRSFQSVEAFATFLLTTFQASGDTDNPRRGEPSALRTDE